MNEVNKNCNISDNESTEGMNIDPSTPANLFVTSNQERELLSSATLDGGYKLPLSKLGASKQIRSGDDSPESMSKKPCTAESKPLSDETDEQRPSYGKAAACAKTHRDYPITSSKAGHLESFQYAHLAAAEDISNGGPQVRFHGCHVVTCAGQQGASWLKGVINAFQP
ncbi:hypothetical protein JTB14_026700 [Gonioctena quinquepunctata]|nr:hypothetical protein JTB14_026700 [Gonioctena quinquepunctata]